MADKFILQVTAGHSYEPSDQKPVPVNSEQPLHISSQHLDASITIRIKNYRGLPQGSPSTSPYFSKEPHTHDLYSLGFSFTPKSDVNGHDLVFGNDFDHPIRDKLPPGFDQAFKIVKWFIDPGLYGDVYADEPSLYGPMLSSINTFRVGGKDGQAQASKKAEVETVEEGADGDGEAARAQSGMPAAAAARKKHYLTEQNLKNFTFEEGRTYSCDFFNPYLDFNDFALKLPGFSLIPGVTIPVISYWDGQPLRYVLKNRKTNEALFVVIFTLVPREHADNAEQQLEAQKDEGNAASAGDVKAAGGDDDLD